MVCSHCSDVVVGMLGWTAEDGGILLDKGASSEGDGLQTREFVSQALQSTHNYTAIMFNNSTLIVLDFGQSCTIIT